MMGQDKRGAVLSSTLAAARMTTISLWIAPVGIVRTTNHPYRHPPPGLDPKARTVYVLGRGAKQVPTARAPPWLGPPAPRSRASTSCTPPPKLGRGARGRAALRDRAARRTDSEGASGLPCRGGDGESEGGNRQAPGLRTWCRKPIVACAATHADDTAPRESSGTLSPAVSPGHRPRGATPQAGPMHSQKTSRAWSPPAGCSP